MKKTLTIAISAAALTLALAACGSSPTKSPDYVGLDAAKNAALADAGVSTADATFTTAELDDKDGTAYYELKFTDGATEYEYDVDALTGVVIEGKKEAADKDNASATTNSATQTASPDEIPAEPDAEDQPTANTTTQTASPDETSAEPDTAITETKAKEIALADAGVKESDTAYLKVKTDYDDGVKVYEVEFYAGGTEYDYEIDAATGKIRSMDHDAEGYTASQTGSAKSEADIQAIALAKVPGATASDLRMHLDHDDGRQVYEGSIYYKEMEYEFTIDAYSGAILEWESESIHD